MADRIKGITIEIDGKFNKLQDSLSGVNKSIKETQSQLRDVNKLLKLDPKNTDLLKQKQELLSKSITDTKDKLAQEKAALEQLKNADGAENTKQQQEALTREIIATQAQLDKLTDQYKEFGSVGQQQLKVVGDNISETGKKITDVGTSITTHVTAPIMAVGAASMAAWAEVDNGLDIVTAKTGASGEALESMQNIVKDIATTIPTSFETAGTAVGEVNTRFGVTGEELEKLSTQFIQFADLNGTDVNNSIDVVQQALNAFGLSADDAGAMLDTLNKVGQDTGINVDKLAQDLVSNATALQGMGMGAADAATLLGQLEKSGIDSSVVMTGLSKVQKDAMESGKSMQDSFAEALSSSESAIDIFGAKAGPKLYEAFQNGTLSADMFAGGMVDLNDALGSVQETFEATQDPSDQLTVAFNELKLVGAEIGEVMQGQLAPIITTITEKLRELKDWFSQLDEGTKNMIVTIAAIVAAIGPVVVVIGTIVSAVGSVISVIGSAMGAISSIGAAIGTVVGILGGPLTIAIAAVIAIGALLIANWDKVKETAAALGQFLGDKFNDIKTTVGDAMTNVGEKVKETWDNAKAKVEEVGGNIKERVSDAFNTAKDTVTSTMTSMGDMVKGKLDNIKSAYEENGGGIKGIVSATQQGIEEYWTLGLDTINTLTGGKLDSIKQSFSEGFDKAKQTVSDAMESIKSTISSAWDKVKSFFKMPHFSISGSFSLDPPSVPHMSVDWYAKAMDNGMILNTPTIFGAMNGDLLGAGEVGSETVVGTNSLMSMIRNAVGETVNYGGVNIVVNGAPGQSEEKLAEIISRRINQSVAKRGAAWG